MRSRGRGAVIGKERRGEEEMMRSHDVDYPFGQLYSVGRAFRPFDAVVHGRASRWAGGSLRSLPGVGGETSAASAAIERETSASDVLEVGIGQGKPSQNEKGAGGAGRRGENRHGGRECVQPQHDCHEVAGGQRKEEEDEVELPGGKRRRAGGEAEGRREKRSRLLSPPSARTRACRESPDTEECNTKERDRVSRPSGRGDEGVTAEETKTHKGNTASKGEKRRREREGWVAGVVVAGSDGGKKMVVPVHKLEEEEGQPREAGKKMEDAASCGGSQMVLRSAGGQRGTPGGVRSTGRRCRKERLAAGASARREWVVVIANGGSEKDVGRRKSAKAEADGGDERVPVQRTKTGPAAPVLSNKKTEGEGVVGKGGKKSSSREAGGVRSEGVSRTLSGEVRGQEVGSAEHVEGPDKESAAFGHENSGQEAQDTEEAAPQVPVEGKQVEGGEAQAEAEEVVAGQENAKEGGEGGRAAGKEAMAAGKEASEACEKAQTVGEDAQGEGEEAQKAREKAQAGCQQAVGGEHCADQPKTEVCKQRTGERIGTAMSYLEDRMGGGMMQSCSSSVPNVEKAAGGMQRSGSVVSKEDLVNGAGRRDMVPSLEDCKEDRAKMEGTGEEAADKKSSKNSKDRQEGNPPPPPPLPPPPCPLEKSLKEEGGDAGGMGEGDIGPMISQQQSNGKNGERETMEGSGAVKTEMSFPRPEQRPIAATFDTSNFSSSFSPFQPLPQQQMQGGGGGGGGSLRRNRSGKGWWQLSSSVEEEEDRRRRSALCGSGSGMARGGGGGVVVNNSGSLGTVNEMRRERGKATGLEEVEGGDGKERQSLTQGPIHPRMKMTGRDADCNSCLIGPYCSYGWSEDVELSGLKTADEVLAVYLIFCKDGDQAMIFTRKQDGGQCWRLPARAFASSPGDEDVTSDVVKVLPPGYSCGLMLEPPRLAYWAVDGSQKYRTTFFMFKAIKRNNAVGKEEDRRGTGFQSAASLPVTKSKEVEAEWIDLAVLADPLAEMTGRVLVMGRSNASLLFRMQPRLRGPWWPLHPGFPQRLAQSKVNLPLPQRVVPSRPKPLLGL